MGARPPSLFNLCRFGGCVAFQPLCGARPAGSSR